MATQQIKSISSQYEEYRNQMKRSKKSEEYRSKRNQQMAQAQKLLESNLPSEKIIHNKDEKAKNKKWNEGREENQTQITRYRDTSNEFQRNGNDDACQMAREGSWVTDESCKSTLNNDLNKLTESDLPVSFKNSMRLNISDCPKLRELKNRMLARKKARRIRLGGKQENHNNHDFRKNLSIDGEMEQHPIEESSISSRKESVQEGDNSASNIENHHREGGLMSGNDRMIKPRQIEENDDQSVVDIDLIYCHHCERSYAPETYKKFCQKVDENGVPKCLSMGKKKRKVYNSAKVRIKNNNQLTSEEQQIAISGRKRAVTDLRHKLKGTSTVKRSQKWREESASFRQAMETNRLVAKAEMEGKPSHYYL